MKIDLKDCNTVLEFLDKIVRDLKVSNYFAHNLERLSGLISSLDKHGFKFPLILTFLNVENYKGRCPQGWKIFVESLQDAKKEYEKRGLKFDYEIVD